MSYLKYSIVKDSGIKYKVIKPDSVEENLNLLTEKWPSDGSRPQAVTLSEYLYDSGLDKIKLNVQLGATPYPPPPQFRAHDNYSENYDIKELHLILDTQNSIIRDVKIVFHNRLLLLNSINLSKDVNNHDIEYIGLVQDVALDDDMREFALEINDLQLAFGVIYPIIILEKGVSLGTESGKMKIGQFMVHTFY